jgi:hypothetical protein
LGDTAAMVRVREWTPETQIIGSQANSLQANRVLEPVAPWSARSRPIHLRGPTTPERTYCTWEDLIHLGNEHHTTLVHFGRLCK